MIIQLLKNKRIVCSFLAFFLIILIFFVNMSGTIVNQEKQSEDISTDFSVSERVCVPELSEIGVYGSKINHNYVNAVRYYNNKIFHIQISKFTSNVIIEYSLIKLPFYNIICALLGLKVIIYIFSSDGKKRIKI